MRAHFLAAALGLLAAVAVQAAPAAGAPAIPFKQDPGSSASLFSGGAVGVLVMSLIAIVAVLFIRKRLNLTAPAASGTRLLRILETQRMGPRTLLAVVEFGGAHYLVAQGEHGVNCLAQAAPPGPAAGVASASDPA
ncbi:hypothetical protein CR152_07265 [Massilia violaceinigra]|uniref:Flagellar biosynthesis protein FliO n=1 Tax=Massilia violaceinigra TaxID=2045208 RepID=A0A2D2DH78_9BURK|nr:flagellar biosynthetic protein FliO [Massilia violaceinigra]ATQ74330.1 hypothetical protein CR152_07265 [Massilia violaceinigra]